MSTDNLPEGWRSVRLGDIFTEAQLDETTKILSTDEPMHIKHRKLQEYYGQFSTALRAKGYDPVFLAFAVPFWIAAAHKKN